MRRHLLIVLLLMAGAVPAWADTKLSAEKAARLLVAQLGSEQFAERERAGKALEALGPAALPALREARKSPECEVRRRADDLVRSITRRAESARLLEAQRLRLVFKDMPVTEALEAFNRTTGFRIHFEGDNKKLAERKITLDTGDTTFWKAFDQFCQLAGLDERPPSSGRDVTNWNEVLELNAAQGGGRFLILDEDRAYALPNQQGQLTLIDSKPQALPTTHDAGSIRIRAPRPPDGKGDGTAAKKGEGPNLYFSRSDGEVQLALEVTTEPRILCQGILNVCVERAVDDKGQELRQTFASANPLSYKRAAGQEVLWDARSGRAVSSLGVSSQVPLRLKTAAQPSALIKELKGTVAVQVRTPPEPLLTMDDLLNAVGRTVTGADGSSLKLLEVKREDGGRVRLRVQVELPPQESLDAFAGQVRVLRLRGMGIRDAEYVQEGTAKHLKLLDGQGKDIAQVSKESGIEGNGENGAVTYRVVCQPHKDQPPPAKLVYTDRRTLIVEVPFVLRDVPLPK